MALVRLDVRMMVGPEKIWAAWTDPRHLEGWFANQAEGRPEVGAEYHFHFEGFQGEVVWKVVEVVPDRRLVFEVPGENDEPDLLEIDILREGSGVRIGLQQSGVVDDETVASGWRMAKAILREYVERKFGQARTTFLVRREGPFVLDRIVFHYRDGEGLASWLVESGRPGRPGAPFAWQLKGGRPLSGRALADTGLEIALSATEIDGVLELKNYPVEVGRAIGLRATSWSEGGRDLEAYRPIFEAAVERLTEVLAAG